MSASLNHTLRNGKKCPASKTAAELVHIAAIASLARNECPSPCIGDQASIDHVECEAGPARGVIVRAV